MKIYKFVVFIYFLVFISIFFTGCWNYREIDKMGIAAGVAVDRGVKQKYKVTVEIVGMTGGKDSRAISQIVAAEGDTIFDAVRRTISITGRRIYWAHAKIVILDKDLAREGVIKIMDWYIRDSETRTDVDLLISGEATASEILSGYGNTMDIKSFEIQEMIRNEKSLSEAPEEEAWRFINDLEGEGISAIAPVIKLKSLDGIKVPEVEGTAIFNDDKLVGFIDNEETKDLLFIKNRIKAGVIVQDEKGKGGICPISLEVFNNKTRIKPVVNGNKISINVITNTTTAIDEIQGSEDYIQDYGRLKLEHDAESLLENRMKKIVKKIQDNYDSDVFGFGSELRKRNPKLWKEISGNWDEMFKNLDVDVNAKVHIRNSALLSKTFK